MPNHFASFLLVVCSTASLFKLAASSHWSCHGSGPKECILKREGDQLKSISTPTELHSSLEHAQHELELNVKKIENSSAENPFGDVPKPNENAIKEIKSILTATNATRDESAMHQSIKKLLLSYRGLSRSRELLHSYMQDLNDIEPRPMHSSHQKEWDEYRKRIVVIHRDLYVLHHPSNISSVCMIRLLAVAALPRGMSLSLQNAHMNFPRWFLEKDRISTERRGLILWTVMKSMVDDLLDALSALSGRQCCAIGKLQDKLAADPRGRHYQCHGERDHYWKRH